MANRTVTVKSPRGRYEYKGKTYIYAVPFDVDDTNQDVVAAINCNILISVSTAKIASNKPTPEPEVKKKIEVKEKPEVKEESQKLELDDTPSTDDEKPPSRKREHKKN